jgi:hypothetical protein
MTTKTKTKEEPKEKDPLEGLIYTFTVEKKETVKETEEQTQTGEDGKEETVSVTKDVEKLIPYECIIRQPNRREMEEAELEYSIEMSKCIKKGILTKAMLAKKYSDSGGLLAEEDAKFLAKKYVEYGSLTNEFQKLQLKKNKTDKDKTRTDELAGQLMETRKHIIDMETSYASLFNHTADARAQNKTISWYMLHLSGLRKEGEEEVSVLFEGEDFQEKTDEYYRLEEGGDEIYDMVSGKLAAFISYWYYSAGAVTTEDFSGLDKDIEEGNI